MRSQTLKVLVIAGLVVLTGVSGGLLWNLSNGAAKAAAQKSEVERNLASQKLQPAPIVALDEVYVSLAATPERTRSLVVNLELELFEEGGRGTVDRYRSALRDLVLKAAMAQAYDELKTLPGKLAFKEHLVGQINTLVNQPVVRNVHFASFYLQ